MNELLHPELFDANPFDADDLSPATIAAIDEIEHADALAQHDPAGCGCGAHQGGPGDIAPISVDTLTTAEPALAYHGERDERFAPCLICRVHTAHATRVCVDCRPRVLARLAYEASRVNAPDALQISHAAADAYAASMATA
jgi:hypothetical protein